MDELTHTNAKGCRHTKRYQDIEALLSVGINVYTTVDVQQIKSFNNVVKSITGVTVRERIPESVFESARQVELIDIEPDGLIERMKKGKGYSETQAQRALDNFFMTD